MALSVHAPMSPSSRIPGFYRLSREERLETLVNRGLLTPAQAVELTEGGLSFDVADQMIENVVGRFELPIGMGLNFVINGVDRVVPMVVEEPSIVAAVSHAAAVMRKSGGFFAEADRAVMTGQIQVVGLSDLPAAKASLVEHAERLVALANTVEPGMQRRGGGALEIEVREVGDVSRPYSHMLVVHLYVDACDAMGANVVNTMCEGIAPEVERLTGGTVVLRILSNLTDRRMVRGRCEISPNELAWHGFAGEDIADGICRASEFAEADVYRAATHNKGIMNGIDAVAIATGQDWRAIEAGAHAYAASHGQYGPLAVWSRAENGNLVGEIEMPMAVGTVGGPIRLHPTVKLLLDVLGVQSAAELACVLASVGLAQNFAALKALASTGIQQGHMALHARSVAATAGAEGAEVAEVAAVLIREKDIKVERATEVLAGLQR
ncbi:MAG: hydroxymethylglutaryl-CoA reductase [Bradymonadia bacterium]|jgi:hydroxymethylglutaryl-CoA reductase